MTEFVILAKNMSRLLFGFNKHLVTLIAIMKALGSNSDRDIAKKDLRLLTLKPCYAKVMTELYNHLKHKLEKT